MKNKEIASYFSLASKLMEIHGENSFRAKSYSVAAYKIEKIATPLSSLDEEKIANIPGIGSAISSKIIEILHTGTMQMLEELLQETPEGILEVMKIKGLGPKKVAVIWKELGIESVGELLYACQENRLQSLSGFGKTTQQNTIEAIEFYLSQKGIFLYAKVEPLTIEIGEYLRSKFPGRIQIVGEFARQEEVIEILEWVVESAMEAVKREMEDWVDFEIEEISADWILGQYKNGFKVKIVAAIENKFLQTQFLKTGNDVFISAFQKEFSNLKWNEFENENELFNQLNIQPIPAFLREDEKIISLAKKKMIPEVIQTKDLKGIIHCHSDWSDGVNTIEEIAKSCIELGLEYLVMSDHSKTAFYANGLTEERVKAQHQQIDELNLKLAPFKIFKSIESDILNDGSLDYSNSILSTFDLVIASVHSNLKMTEEKAMMRLMAAIENPYTTILGHMTGRLLLSRKGYPVDHKRIIDACAANGVVIEINASPSRLDMRWQWISYALEKNVLLSINPDLHSLPEVYNLKYGILVAQKGMLTAANNLSSFSLEKLEQFIQFKKQK